jgi:hypothetical protein
MGHPIMPGVIAMRVCRIRISDGNCRKVDSDRRYPGATILGFGTSPNGRASCFLRLGEIVSSLTLQLAPAR